MTFPANPSRKNKILSARWRIRSISALEQRRSIVARNSSLSAGFVRYALARRPSPSCVSACAMPEPRIGVVGPFANCCRRVNSCMSHEESINIDRHVAIDKLECLFRGKSRFDIVIKSRVVEPDAIHPSQVSRSSSTQTIRYRFETIGTPKLTNRV